LIRQQIGVFHWQDDTMAIAAALNILVSAPTRELTSDLKKVGVSVGELKRTIKDLYERSTTASEKFERQLFMVNKAFEKNALGAEELHKFTKMLEDDYRGVTAEMERMAKKAESLKTRFEAPTDKFSRESADLNALKGSGQIDDYVYAQAKSALVKQLEDQLGITDKLVAAQKELDKQEKANAKAALEQAAAREKAKRALDEQRWSTYASVEAEKLAAKLSLNEQKWASIAATEVEKLAAKKALNEQKWASIAAAEVEKLAAKKALTEQKWASIAATEVEKLAAKKALTEQKWSMIAAAEAEKLAAKKALNEQKWAMIAEAEQEQTRQAIEQEKLFNVQRERANQLFANVSPLQKYKNEVREYIQLLRAGVLTQAQYNALLAGARKEYWQGSSMMGKAFGKSSQFLAATGLSNPYLLVGTALAVLGKGAADFEKEMSAVNAVSEVSNTQLAKLADTARTLSMTSIFSPTEVAQAAKFLAQAGMDVNEIEASLADVLDLATIGDMDLAYASEAAVRVMGGMQLRADEFTQVVDALAVGSAETVADVEDLVEAFKFVGPLAHLSGQGIDDVTAALMALHEVGIPGEMAGTGLRNIFNRMSNPTKEAADALKDLGIGFATAADGGFDLVQIVHDFNEAMDKKGLVGVERIAMVNKIFKDRSGGVFSGLLSAGDEKLQGYLDMQQNAGGKAKEMSDEAMDNFWGDLKKFGNQISSMASELWESILSPVFRFVLGFLQPVIAVLDVVVKGLSIFPTLIMSAVEMVYQAILGMAYGIAVAADYIPGVDTTASQAALKEELKASKERQRERDKTIKAANEELWGGGATSEAAKPTTPDPVTGAPVTGAEQFAAMQEDVYQQTVADLQTQIEQVGMTADELERAKLAHDGLTAGELEYVELLQEQLAYEKMVADADTKRVELKTQLAELGKTEGEILAEKGVPERLANEIDLLNHQIDVKTKLLDVEKELAIQKFKNDMYGVKSGTEATEAQLLERLYMENDGVIDAMEEKAILAQEELDAQQQIAKTLREQHDSYMKRMDDEKKNFQQLEDRAKELNEAADPKLGFQEDFAQLEAMNSLGLLKGDAYNNQLAALEQQFAQRQGQVTVAGSAVERGSQEDYAARVGANNPNLEVAKKQLEEIKNSHETHKRIETILKGSDRVVEGDALPPA
jgi:TP901 family phage tail tape measure protein